MRTPDEVKALIAAEQEALDAGEMVSERRDFLVVEERLDALKKKLDAYARRAAKLGLPPVTYTVGDFLDDPETRYRDDPYSDTGFTAYTILVRKFAVHIDGDAPKLSGWTFAATIQHLDGGENVIRSILDVPVPAVYRTSPCRCDHCGTVRRRIDTHLVYKSETGEWKQIGSSCIADFLGSVEADRLARQAEYLRDALDAAGGSEGGGSIKPRYALVEVLVLAAGAIQQFGWVSRKKAKELEASTGAAPLATADIVARNLCGSFPVPKDLRIEVQPGHQQVAEEAIAWAQGLTDADVERSDYLHNVRAIARSASIEARLFGYACSIVPAHQREMDRARERAAEAESKKASEHVGEVGKRIVLTLKVLSVKHLESDWGVTSLHLFVDEAGNRFKWFSSSVAFDVGTTVTVKGTVKGHDEYKGCKQTLLSRVAEYTPPPPKEKKPRRSHEEVLAEKVAKGLVKFFEAVARPAKGCFFTCSGCNQEIGNPERDHMYHCPLRKEWFWTQGGTWSKCSGCGKESMNRYFSFYNDHTYIKDAEGNYTPCPVMLRATWGLVPNRCSGCQSEHVAFQTFEPLRPQDHLNGCSIFQWATWGVPEPKCSGCGATVHVTVHRGEWRDAVYPGYHQHVCPIRKPEMWGEAVSL